MPVIKPNAVVDPLVRDLGRKLADDCVAAVQRTVSLVDDPHHALAISLFALNAVFAGCITFAHASTGANQQVSPVEREALGKEIAGFLGAVAAAAERADG